MNKLEEPKCEMCGDETKFSTWTNAWGHSVLRATCIRCGYIQNTKSVKELEESIKNKEI